jgi:hypothetical protein
MRLFKETLISQGLSYEKQGSEIVFDKELEPYLNDSTKKVIYKLIGIVIT